MPSARSTFSDKLLLPLLGRHRLVADGIPRTHLDLVGEHAEVLADRDERRMLVVQPHAHLAVGALRNLGNRRGDVGVHLLAGHDAHPGQEHPRDADHAVLALVGERVKVIVNTVSLVPSGRLDEDTAAAISAVSQSSTGAVRIRMHNKLAALVALGKYLGMFDQRPQNSNVIYGISDEPMSAEEWKKQYVKPG